MQPYVNPYLFSSPIYGNYGQQQFQNQPMQQPMQQIGISGKYVNDFNEITASDIPMNSPAIFTKNDRSEIQLREWNANGQITTTSYKPVIEEPIAAAVTEPAFNPDSVLDPILNRLKELEDKIDKLPKPTISRAKKDGE